MNFTEEKIEMICGRKMKVTTEIEMSTEVKALLESDPKAAAQFRDVVEALEAERRAEMEQKMKKPVCIEELMNERNTKTEESDSEDEDEAPVDRWNSPLPGREATCVNLIKELIAFIKDKDTNEGVFPMTYKGKHILGVYDESDSVTYTGKRAFGFAFTSWLILNEHKLDGRGGNWCSGCFGSFWADIALTIVNLNGVYYGCRVSFNPNPVGKNEAFFILSISEKLKTYNPLKAHLPSTACFPQYGPHVNWGYMHAEASEKNTLQKEVAKKSEQRLKEEEDAAKLRAERRKEEEERKAKQEEKAAKLRAENEQRRKEEEERKAKFAAERALIEQQAAIQRQAEFAAKVAALAEREKAAKEQERLAKLEQARISEENKKLKAQQKEAERIAKFGNKKK